MIKTRLTELVGLKYPIIQAGMGPYPVTSLCIAAANAGCHHVPRDEPHRF